MPKPVHDLVDTLLDDPDFYPENQRKIGNLLQGL
jgi:hypothetical protein